MSEIYIDYDQWYTINKPMYLGMDNTIKYAKVHSRERILWVLKCIAKDGFDWMSYAEDDLLYHINKKNITPSTSSEILDAMILEGKIRR